MAADDVDVDAKEVGQLASEPGEVEKRGIVHLQGSRYQSASERLLGRPTRRYVRSRSRTHRPTTQCRPSGSRPSHGVEDSRWFLFSQTASSRSGYPPSGQALGWWPQQSVCQRSANGLPPIGSGPFVCDSLFGSGSATDAGSVLSRTPSPVVRSTTSPAGGDRGAQQFPLVTRGSRMRIGRGLHPIQVRPSRNDDVELDVLER